MATEQQIREANARVTLKPPRELTAKEKRQNWWYYNKNMVIIITVVVLIFLNVVCNALGLFKVKPDYSIAYVGSVRLDEDTSNALIKCLQEITPDMNGDGKVTVQLQQYICSDTGDSDSLYYAQAAQTQMVADITSCTSYFFLLEDPSYFQENTTALRSLDGSLPAAGDLSADGKYYIWQDCPALADIASAMKDQYQTEKDFSGLAFARRGFWTEKTSVNAEACDLLWEQLTEGAVPPQD